MTINCPFWQCIPKLYQNDIIKVVSFFGSMPWFNKFTEMPGNLLVLVPSCYMEELKVIYFPKTFISLQTSIRFFLTFLSFCVVNPNLLSLSSYGSSLSSGTNFEALLCIFSGLPVFPLVRVKSGLVGLHIPRGNYISSCKAQ